MLHGLSRIAVAAIVAAIAVTPAMAQDSTPKSVEVRLGDLDLRQDADVARLNQRIKSAATSACGRPDPRNLRMIPLIRRCQEEAFNRASHRAEAIVAAVRQGKDQRLAVRETGRIMAR